MAAAARTAVDGATVDVVVTAVDRTTSVVINPSMISGTIDTLQSSAAAGTTEMSAVVAIISTVESVTHSDTSAVVSDAVISSEDTSVVPTASTVQVPAMSATVCPVEVRTTEVEIGAVRIACIDAEVPVSCIPV